MIQKDLLLQDLSSRSSLGDGGYECFIHTNSEGKVDGIKIVFIDENSIEEVYE